MTFLTLPLVAFAQDAIKEGLRSSGISRLFPNSTIADQGVGGLIYFVVNLMLYLAGAVAVIFVIIGGYYYLTAGGNEEQAEKGKKTLINAIIGIVIIILSYVIVNVISNLVTNGALGQY